MHVLIIHQAFAVLGEPGGTRHHEMARYLRSKGHRVTILTGQMSYFTGERTASGWCAVERDDVGVEIWRSFSYRGWHHSFLHRMISFFSFMFSSFIAGLRVEDVDLVWGTSPPIFQGITAWALARIRRVKFLFEVRDLWPAFAVAVGVLRNPALIFLSRWLERFLYRRADRVVVNSPGYVSFVRARGASQVDLVPNGVDISMFTPQSKGDSYRQEMGLEGKVIALYAGAHGLSNDLDLVLDAAEILQDEHEILFVLVGAGKEKPRLKRIAREKGLKNVRFLPPEPKERMAQVLAAADLCIAVLKPIELYKTTYPNKVFDYMAAGRPIALAIDGVIREVVEGAKAGLFVPPGDAKALAQTVLQLAQDDVQRRAMGDAGRNYVTTHFNRGDQVRKLLQVMTSLVEGERSV